MKTRSVLKNVLFQIRKKKQFFANFEKFTFFDLKCKKPFKKKLITEISDLINSILKHTKNSHKKYKITLNKLEAL